MTAARYTAANNHEVAYYFGYDLARSATDSEVFYADWLGLTPTEKLALRQEIGWELDLVQP